MLNDLLPLFVEGPLLYVPAMLTPYPVSVSIPSHPTSLTIIIPQLARSPVAVQSMQRHALLPK